jgi:hypothetical protein
LLTSAPDEDKWYPRYHLHKRRGEPEKRSGHVIFEIKKKKKKKKKKNFDTAIFSNASHHISIFI